tara:strand:+ start:2492 stop:2758 length:267 start_codon:yes stop_codon:yes gene_type:complete
MSEDNLTQEEIQNSINAAFDSVGLINGIISGDQMNGESIQEKKDTIDRNVSHLEIMTGKSWFNDGLVSGQADQITDAVTAGNGFITAN